MADTQRKGKAPETPRQREIRILVQKGRDKRTDQESARLDQLKSEERRDRFLRLAVKRTPKAMKAMAQVANLGNRGNYEYTDAEAAKIITALEDVMERIRDAFSARAKENAEFSL